MEYGAKIRDRLRKSSPSDRAEATKLPPHIKDRLERGRARLEKIAPARDEAWEFYRGNHYAYVDERNRMQVLPTVTTIRGTGKPSHRARQTRNLIFDVVLRKAAGAARQVPSYSVLPTTTDPDDMAAAGISQKVLLYGYEKWKVREAAVKTAIGAVVAGEAFAWPYFDNTVGPFITGTNMGVGEIRIPVFGANQVYWEPGLRFPDSAWHVIEQAMAPEQVKRMQDYLGGDLSADAASRSLANKQKTKGGAKKLVLVAYYLERPTPEHPEGRWYTVANERQICAERPYPGDGVEPCLRRLSYAVDPDSDRDLGLVTQLLDCARTKNDSDNKAVEWKNHVLHPRLFVTPGLMKKQRWTDQPGKLYEIPQPDQNVKVVETPPVPPSLYEMADRAVTDLTRIAALTDIEGSQSGKEISARNEFDMARDSLFYGDLADWYAGIGHDCLSIVQQSYSEPRLIQIKGEFSWEPVADFQGSQLRDQLDVRVLPASIEPVTRAAQEQKIMNYVQMQAISPEEGMAAIEMGSAELVTRGLVLDESRAGRIIQSIKDNTIFGRPLVPTGRLEKVPAIDPETGGPLIDPMTGQPAMVETGQPEMGPWWMPRYSDNLPIMKSTFEDWMKTEDYERLDEEMANAASQVYGAILQLEQQKAAEAAQAQMAQASEYGMANAAAPQAGGPKPQASLPSVQGNGTPEQ